VDKTEHGIAGHGGFANDTDAQKVVDFFELLASVFHLGVDGIEMLCSGINLYLQVGFGGDSEKIALYLIQILLALLFLHHHMRSDLVVGLGFQILEAEILQFRI
jgi:hypothetical protein